MAQKTHPKGREPRQEYIGCHVSQRECAELLAKNLKCSSADLLVGRSDPEGRVPRLYKGVFYHIIKKRWIAQITHPAGHKPRQEPLGQGFPSQKAAAKALAEHLGVTLVSLRLKKAEFYTGALASRKALQNFQVLQQVWVKKKMIPGRTIC